MCKILNPLLSVSSGAVTLGKMSRIEEPVQIGERLGESDDDHLADFIKGLTQDDVHWIWLTILQSKPHLAD
jgi:hypothetical protein